MFILISSFINNKIGIFARFIFLDVRQNNKFFNLDERNYKKCSVA